MKAKSLFLCVLLTGLIYLTGCGGKVPIPPPLLGTWNMSTERSVQMSNNVTVHDTTFTFPQGYNTWTFNTNGTYLLGGIANAGLVDTGTYTLAGDTLSLFNPAIGPQAIKYSLVSITQRDMYLQNSNLLPNYVFTFHFAR